MDMARVPDFQTPKTGAGPGSVWFKICEEQPGLDAGAADVAEHGQVDQDGNYPPVFEGRGGPAPDRAYCAAWREHCRGRAVYISCCPDRVEWWWGCGGRSGVSGDVLGD